MPELNLDPGNILIFRNDKGDNPKRPDLRGELVTPEGERFEVALWTRAPKKGGDKFLSGSVQAPREQAPAQTSTDDDSSIPF